MPVSLLQMKKIIFLTLVSFVMISCGGEIKNDVTGAWFGGEIVNPNTNHIILTKNEKVIDTIPLDGNNRFLYYIENVEKGIYNFIHNEYQMVYLEPGDSLMLRLNTIEFDESLAFTGKGAERNNFLINMFNYNESENQRMRPFYQLPVDEFLQKLDSMSKVRFENLNRFIKRFKPCKSFYEVAEANILYDKYTKMEFYPFVNSNYNETSDISLPSNYYDFRKNVDYNNEALQSYYTYYRFMLWHFDYLAYKQYKNEHPFERASLAHITHKLKTIDSLINLESLKNSLLRTSTRRYIISCKNPDHEKNALELYLSLTTDKDHKEEMIKISEASLKLMPGEKLPELTIYNFNGERVSFEQIINRPTVIYFWSINSLNHLRNVHSKADELKAKYPEFDFIAINTNADKDTWKQIINRHGFDNSKEFRFQDPSKAMEHLIVNTVNKSMIINKDAKIIDNHTNMFSVRFEEQLLGILNQ
jgi:hypothetical protein